MKVSKILEKLGPVDEGTENLMLYLKRFFKDWVTILVDYAEYRSNGVGKVKHVPNELRFTGVMYFSDKISPFEIRAELDKGGLVFTVTKYDIKGDKVSSRAHAATITDSQDDIAKAVYKTIEGM